MLISLKIRKVAISIKIKMDKTTKTFNIDKELDLKNHTMQDVVDSVKGALSNVKSGNYMLVNINDYSCIAEIAKAAVSKGTVIDNVLKKSEKSWVIMLKNSVPVAQSDRA